MVYTNSRIDNLGTEILARSEVFNNRRGEEIRDSVREKEMKRVIERHL